MTVIYFHFFSDKQLDFVYKHLKFWAKQVIVTSRVKPSIVN